MTSGYRKVILSQAGVIADIRRRGEAIADAAGEGVEADTRMGSTRPRALVTTETFEAMYAEATERTLTRAIDAGRG